LRSGVPFEAVAHSRLDRRDFIAAALACSVAPRSADARAPSCLAPLFAKFPRLEATIPHVALGSFPTPVERARELGETLGHSALWVKRDDVSGSYGGGKTRKLETFLGEALERGKKRVASFGGFGSNQGVAVAHYAKALGLESELYLLAERRSEHARRNLEAMLALARHVEITGSVGDAMRRIRRKQAEAPYVVPLGGSSPLGTVPFVAAAFEIAEQVAAGAMPRPDVVVVAAGTLGTAAGLALGFSALGWSTRVHAVRASSPGTSSRRVLARLLRDTRAFLRERAPGFPGAGATHVRIDGHELGRGYAFPTTRGKRALELAEKHGGLELELTYTAKALASVGRRAKELGDSAVLFWHTASSRSLTSRVQPDRVPPAFRAFLRRG
jgi:D-cysteine desulfhydrase